jgi:ABC-type glycerol-3-phosphate transport system substrate-binding protein
VRSAILSYLKLHRFIPKDMYHCEDADQMFSDGKVAVVIGGPWNMIRSARTPEVINNLGVAIPLGCSYVAASSLIIWEQTNQTESALELIAHLTGREFQITYPGIIGLLPVRLDSLDSFPVPDPSLSPIILKALKTGRSLPASGIWGVIEDRLTNALPDLWDDILAVTKPDLEVLYDKHISPLAKRLNMIIA